MGAVAYSTVPHTLDRPGTDRSSVEDLIDNLSADGGTATGDALEQALELLGPRDGNRRPARGDRAALGRGDHRRPRSGGGGAAEARRARVPIYTVALGTSEGVIQTPRGLLPVPPDPETMRDDRAGTSGGRAFTADDAEGLDDVYEQLGSRLGHQAGAARDHGGFRGRGTGAAAGRGRPGRARRGEASVSDFATARRRIHRPLDRRPAEADYEDWAAPRRRRVASRPAAAAETAPGPPPRPDARPAGPGGRCRRGGRAGARWRRDRRGEPARTTMSRTPRRSVCRPPRRASRRARPPARSTPGSSPAWCRCRPAAGPAPASSSDRDGTIVTNAHVVGSAESATVRFGEDGDRIPRRGARQR